MIIKDLREAGAKVPDILEDSEFPVFKAEWERLKEEGKIAKTTIIDVYKEKYREETRTALNSAKKEIENLRKAGHERYHRVRQELEKMSDYKEGNNSINDDLKRKLEDLFKFEYNDQEVEQKLIKSVKSVINNIELLVNVRLANLLQLYNHLYKVGP